MPLKISGWYFSFCQGARTFRYNLCFFHFVRIWQCRACIWIIWKVEWSNPTPIAWTANGIDTCANLKGSSITTRRLHASVHFKVAILMNHRPWPVCTFWVELNYKVAQSMSWGKCVRPYAEAKPAGRGKTWANHHRMGSKWPKMMLEH